jgi:hypothetical protein
MEKLVVDFVLPDGGVEAMPATQDHPLPRRPIKCHCGSVEFVVANVLSKDAHRGIPASLMYECTACGEYRLG